MKKINISLCICCAVAMAVAVFTATPSVYSGEASRELILQGAHELGRNRFNEALEFFQKAVEADPQAGETHFLTGLALNQLGQYPKALKSLQQAEKLKTEYRDLYLELGQAYLFTRQYQRAIEALTHYEAIKPGRGLTMDLFGRTYLALEEWDKAEQAFQEAQKRDSHLASSSEYFLAAILLHRGEREEATALLKGLVERERGTAIGRAAQDLLDTSQLRDRRWSFLVDVGGGYDSNVIGFGDGQPLPSGISDRHAFFFRSLAGVDFESLRTDRDNLLLRYRFSNSLYEDLSDFNKLDHLLALFYRRRFDKRISLNLAAQSQYSAIGSESLGYDFTLSPSMDVRLADWAVVRLPYSMTVRDDLFPGTPVLDRDGISHTAGIVQLLRFLPTGITGHGGYFHTWNLTDGSDYDFGSDTLSAGINLPLPWKSAMDVRYRYIYERYKNPNSRTNFSRRDHVDVIRVELTKVLNPFLSVYTTYDYVRNNSNVSTYDYSNRHAWTSGVTVRF